MTKRNQAKALPAGSQRVENNKEGMAEIKEVEEARSNEPSLATFEIDSTFEPTLFPSLSLIITQEDSNSPPSVNTRNQQQGIITQYYMLQMMEQAAKQSPFCCCPLKFTYGRIRYS